MRCNDRPELEQALGITAITVGTERRCTDGRYLYWDRVQGVYAHEDNGSTCYHTFDAADISWTDVTGEATP